MLEKGSAILTPAYGRDYKTALQIEADFRAGKDFVFAGVGQIGRYCSIRDFKPGTTIELRYNRKIDLTMVEV